MLSVALRLRDLWVWEPVGREVESLRCAMEGHEGFTSKQAVRLMEWAERWEHIPEHLKQFYLRHMNTNQTVSVALYYKLEKRKIEEWQLAILKQLWSDDYGYRPQYDIW